MQIPFLAFLFFLSSCSLQKIALRSSTGVFEKSSQGLLREGDWDFFRQAAPSQIKLLELLWLQDKENLSFLSLLIKSYAGYAFAVPETLYFEDEITDKEDSYWKKRAISFYTRALDYGVLYLEHKGISREDLLKKNEEHLRKKLNNLKEEDLISLLYTAQSWGSLINLQKDNITLLAQVSKVKLLFDKVCQLKPDIEQNVCDIFYAQYHISRPKMLGGDPDKGKKLFQRAIKDNPFNLLIRLNYIQYVVLPAYDEEEYERQAGILKKLLADFTNLNRENLLNESEFRDYQNLNLYNSIARKRFLIIEQNKKIIF